MTYVCTIPVRDVSRSICFYRDILGFDVTSQCEDYALISRMSCKVMLKRSDNVGVDTGLFFTVDSPYHTRRRLIDLGVVFVVDPTMGPFGTYTSFRDDDGNIISVVDGGFASE